jgi:hypothetical protein
MGGTGRLTLALAVASLGSLPLGCLIFSTDLAYIEYRFGILRSQWDLWLLLSSALYFRLAYRFDNRFVLSLGIATLGGWFGVRLSQSGLVLMDPVRTSALGYAAVVVLAGVALAGGAVDVRGGDGRRYLPPELRLRRVRHALRVRRSQHGTAPPHARRYGVVDRCDGISRIHHHRARAACTNGRKTRMRRYSLDDEERIRLQARLRDWTHAGFVSEERRAAIEPDLATTLRRTGLMLRFGSAVLRSFA